MALAVIIVSVCIMRRIIIYRWGYVQQAITVTIGHGKPDDGATNDVSDADVEKLPPATE
jgi:hypothetical protein